MESLNIVELIEKNPITRLSKNYQNVFIKKIKENFTEEQQRLFVANFYCYLNYKDDEFVINLHDIWKWIGYNRVDAAKTALNNNFKIDSDYIIFGQKNTKAAPDYSGPAFQSKSDGKNKGGAGLNKEVILMTVDTFKNFCMLANTEKAKSVRTYYVKMEKLVSETFQTEMEEIRLQLEENDNKFKQKEIDHINDKKTEKHKFLLDKFKGKRCVYLAEICFNNDIFIKIGSTENITERLKQHIKTYNNFILLDIFESDEFRHIEMDILSDTDIVKNLYREEINGHRSQECILLSDNFNYNQIIYIVKKYVDKIKGFTNEQLIEKQRLDLEKQKLEYEMIIKLMNDDRYTDIVKNKLENFNFKTFTEKQIEIIKRPLEEDETNIPNHQSNITTELFTRAPKGRKIQKINPNNFKDFKVYDSMIYVLRANENIGFQKSSLQVAIRDNRIYKGWRWNFVEKDEDPNIVNIQPTENYETKASIISTILQLNKDKTEIINTFHTKDFLAKELNLSKPKMKKIIQNEELHNDYYYIEHHKCSEELLKNYKKEINRKVPTNSIQIKQIHPITKEIVIFNSLTEIYIKFGVSSSTIKKAIENKLLNNGYLWEYYQPYINDESENTHKASSSKDV